MITEIDNCSYNTKHQAATKKLGEHGIKLASMDYVSTSLQYQLNLSISRDTSKHQQNNYLTVIYLFDIPAPPYTVSNRKETRKATNM